MSFMQRRMNDTITYWPKAGDDGFGGSTFGKPDKIRGRWERRSELYRDGQGREVRSSAVVYVDQDVVQGGFLALGQHTHHEDPRDVAKAREIRFVAVSGSVRDPNEVLRKVML